ncbi:MAG: LCP family protein, partial [Parcubacteria group bacterium]|nr:LCP family protein [Parcubacteria group bacterium]
TDTAYPGPNRTYQLFHLDAGTHVLDGDLALKYIRSRHTGRGDFDRIKRQQDVLRAIREKVRTLHPLTDFGELYDIFASVRAHSDTDIGFWEGTALWELLRDIPDESIYAYHLSADSQTGLLTYGRIPFKNSVAASVLWPRAGQFSYDVIHATVRDLLAEPRPIPL